MRETSLACPFCGRRARLVRGAVIGAGRAMAGTLVLGVMLGACGNDAAPPPPPTAAPPTAPTTQTQPTSAPPEAPTPAAPETAPSQPAPVAGAEPVAAPAEEAPAPEPEAVEVTPPAPGDPLAPSEPPPSRRIVRRPTPTTMDPGPRDPRLIAAYGGAPMPDRPEL